MSPLSALVVASDSRLGSLLAAGLRANGYDATWTPSTAQAEQLLSAQLGPASTGNVVVVVTSSDEPLSPIVVADLVVDIAARRCCIGGREVPLRAKEFDVLCLLARHRDHLVSREDLMSEVWDENWSRSTKTLDVTMAGVRRRLREVGAMVPGAVVPNIATLRGCGYRLDSLAEPRLGRAG